MQRRRQAAELLLLLGASAGLAAGSGVGCRDCVAQGRTWQGGECQERVCPIADAACYKTSEDCNKFEENARISARCSAMEKPTCEACLAADPGCMWNKGSQDCFNGSGYWGPPDNVVRAGQSCSVGGVPPPPPGYSAEEQAVDGRRQPQPGYGGPTTVDKSSSLKS